MSLSDGACRIYARFSRFCERIPYAITALVARIAISGVFWKSGQTKVEGFAVDLFAGNTELGWPRLSDSAVDLFRDEYQLPLIAPEIAAPLAAFAEHLFPLMLLLGLGTRLGALGLLAMTAVIQFFVYPSAWTTHGLWAAVLLMLITMGPGRLSVDAWLSHHFSAGKKL